jgi:hypothetical protein
MLFLVLHPHPLHLLISFALVPNGDHVEKVYNRRLKGLLEQEGQVLLDDVGQEDAVNVGEALIDHCIS